MVTPRRQLYYYRRQQQRGAAVFLVVMVLTLVTAIGVFSMRSASLVNLATGFNRQGVQATALAEFGARAAATYLGDAAIILDETGNIAGCAANLQAQDATAYCQVLKLSYTASAPQAFSDGLPGLLSLPGDPTVVRGEFVTELTEPGPASVLSTVGFDNGQFKQVTLTTKARVFPTNTATTNVCAAGARTAVSERIVRAHVSVHTN
jgi:Tfp pilus assembly protein PilX